MYMYVDDARRGVDLEAEVVFPSLCEWEASFQLLDDARFDDRRSVDEDVFYVDEDDADHANAVDNFAKHEHAATERQDAGCECGEEERRERVVPDAPCVGGAVRVIARPNLRRRNSANPGGCRMKYIWRVVASMYASKLTTSNYEMVQPNWGQLLGREREYEEDGHSEAGR